MTFEELSRIDQEYQELEGWAAAIDAKYERLYKEIIAFAEGEGISAQEILSITPRPAMVTKEYQIELINFCLRPLERYYLLDL